MKTHTAKFMGVSKAAIGLKFVALKACIKKKKYLKSNVSRKQNKTEIEKIDKPKSVLW